MINREIFCKSGPWFCGRHRICTDIMPLAGVHTFMRLTAGSSDKFPTYSPSGDTLFDFVVVYNAASCEHGAKSATTDCLLRCKILRSCPAGDSIAAESQRSAVPLR